MSFFKYMLLTGAFCAALYSNASSQIDEPIISPSLKGFSKDIWKDGIRYNFDDKGERYIRFTMLGQFWARYNQNNPGTLFFDEPKDHQWDFSLRRMRMQFLVQPHERLFIYTQLGINNFNYVTARKPSFFLHDFSIEYMPIKKYLFIGGGLQSWGVSSRFGASGISSMLGVDLPVYQEPLNDQTDQFVRNLGVYVKGAIHKLNYRITLNKPFAFAKSESFNPNNVIANYPLFSPRDPALEIGGYWEWNFFEHEYDLTPYKAGTYLGNRKILNIGAGARYRKNATWYKTQTGDTAFAPMILGTIDLFAELPLKSASKTALNIYGAYTYSYFGPDFIKTVAPNNIATGTSLNPSRIYGGGNAIPLVGTGNSLYFQGGVITPPIPKTELKFMPYTTFFIADYRVIKKPITVYEAGVSLIIKGNALKLTAGWQNRPFFYQIDANALRRNMAVIQMQFSI